MPIYAYRCAECGHAKDVLQKLSDAPLTVCPACGASAFAKQLTAAGFQLKGSGWYVTDFKGGASGGAAKAEGGGADAGKGEAGKGDAGKGDGGKAGDAGAAAATASAAPAASSSGGCGGGCACH